MAYRWQRLGSKCRNHPGDRIKAGIVKPETYSVISSLFYILLAVYWLIIHGQYKGAQWR
jgi:hypothetical protein